MTCVTRRKGGSFSEAALLVAERVGFEPTEPEGSRALQARAFGRTMQPLQAYYDLDYTTR